MPFLHKLRIKKNIYKIGYIFFGIAGFAQSEKALAQNFTNVEGVSTLQMDLLLNARIFAYEKNTAGVLKIWFAQSALPATSKQSEFQQDILSTVWWTVAQGNVCPDNLAKDSQGAAIWTLALHNFLIANISGRKRAERPVTSPFQSFEQGKQTRNLALNSKVDAADIQGLKLVKLNCKSRSSLLNILDEFSADREFLSLGNKGSVARVLQILLEKFRTERNKIKVPNGDALLQSKIFDLNLYLIGELTKKFKTRGPANVQITDNFLMKVATWEEAEWEELNSSRRLFLYDQAKPFIPSNEQKNKILFALLDDSIETKNGVEINAWLSQLYDSKADLATQIWRSDRAKKIAELPDTSGFTEVSYVAFQRALTQVNTGAFAEAMKSFAFALKSAERSNTPLEVRIASRRWLSYCLATYKLDDTLKQYLLFSLPFEDAVLLQEDLAWRAAFRKDLSGYELVRRSLKLPVQRAKLLDKLKPLVQGKTNSLLKLWNKDLDEEPAATLKDLENFVQRVETEDQEVKVSLNSVLEEIKSMLLKLAMSATESKRKSKLSDAARNLILRLDALTKKTKNVRDLSPQSTTFVGFVRSIPNEQLAFPFAYPQTTAPDPFTALRLTPWDDLKGEVLGWRISE